MIVVSLSGNTLFDTKDITSISFPLKRDKKDKIYKRKGEYIVDKSKIDILFKSGVMTKLVCLNEADGQKTFDTIFEAMKKDNE